MHLACIPGAPLLRCAAQALDEERQMREYRAQLDADRAAKLSRGTNHADLRGAVQDGKSKVRVLSSSFGNVKDAMACCLVHGVDQM